MILAVAHDSSSGKMDKTWIRYIRHIDIKTQAILQPILASCQCGGSHSCVCEDTKVAKQGSSILWLVDTGLQENPPTAHA